MAKKIVIVSNKRDHDKDYSGFVDSCDVVVRVNKLDNIDEENKICQEALKMNSLMQGEHLTTSNIEDIDDEAEDILKREAPEKLCEVATDEKHDFLGEGEEQIKVDFDFDDEGKAKSDELNQNTI